MRLLAHDSSQVPPRYQADPRTLSVGGNVIANGPFVEVRKGRLGGRTVAVRTLRFHREINPWDVRKVRVAPN